MYFVSVTRLRIRSVIYLPRFLKANEASIKSITKIEGFVAGKELVDKGLTFWTVTLWESDQAMKYFRNHDPHKSAMRNLPEWCNEASYGHWVQDEAAIPGWNVLHQKFLDNLKITKVKHPSCKQEAKDYPAPKWKKIERSFKSAGSVVSG